MALDTALIGRSSRNTPSEEQAAEKQGPERPRWLAFATQAVGLVRETFVQWRDDEASRLAAALALYTLLSIAPLLVVSIAVAGLVFGNDAARGQLSQQVGKV